MVFSKFLINIKRHSAYIIFGAVATWALFLGFYRNQWNAVRDPKFNNFDRASEGFIIGRLVQSRQDGVFSKAALLGMGDVNPSNITEVDSNYQYETYYNGGNFSTYFIYRSQPAFQAVIFSSIDSISPFTASQNLHIFRRIISLFTAITIGLILVWIYRDFGLLSASMAFFTTMYSKWITPFAHNIFWGIWIYFLPMLGIIFIFELDRKKKDLNAFRLGGIVFFFILLKCLFSGYDFISTAAISTCIPIIYYGIIENWNISYLLRMITAAVLGTSAAIFLSLVILATQISFIDGNLNKGTQYIIDSILRRTYGDPSYYAHYAVSLQANVTDVLNTYLTRDSFFLKLPLSFLDVSLIFLFFSCLFILLAFWRPKGENRKGYALIAATWLAFIGSISTFVIFKSASFIHTHLYYIVWHLPYTILGFALCGYTLKVFYKTLFTFHSKR